jgi:hypothetical protein
VINGVTAVDSLKDIKLKIVGKVVEHEVETFKSGGKTVVRIGPKVKLTFADLPAKFTITIGTKVGTEQVKKTFSLTKAATGDIYSWRDLDKIRDNLSGVYTLKNDIKFPKDNTYGYGTKFTPIGDGANKFTGKLDGKNHTIAGLKIIETGDNVGLFGVVGGKIAEIKNLIIDHAGISGVRLVGSVAGKIDNNAKITNVGMISSTGAKVSATDAVGGLVGSDESDVVTITGYARNTVRRTSGTSATFGKLVGRIGNNIVHTIKGYHSTGESRVVVKDGTTELTGTKGIPGDPIKMETTTAQGAFSKFVFTGPNPKWLWVATGKWPAINIGTLMPKDKQPTK